jgi:DNA-binding response OmpR family regulator
MTKKILIVEDHDNLRRLLGLVLSRDFKVVSTSNGLEAMSWLSQGEIPDAIVTDSRMPELNGTELIYNLRQSGLYADIPVIVVSGADSSEEEFTFRNLGVSDYLHKPFSPKHLRDRLNTIFSDRFVA